MAIFLALLAFSCGAFAIVAQSFLAREFLVVFLGNEMSLSLLLAAWLVGVASGARLARLRVLARMNTAFLTACALTAWVVLFPAALMAVRLSRLILPGDVGTLAPLWQLLVVAFLFVGAFSSFVGLVFVLLCRLRERVLPGAGSLGPVYVAEAAGGALGGALFTFCLAGRVGPFSVGFAAYAVILALVVALALLARRCRLLAARSAASVALGACLLASVALAALLSGRGATLDRNSHVARMSSLAKGVVMASRDTPYQNLSVLLLSGQYTVYGNGEPLVTFPEGLLNERDAFLLLAEHPDPRSVLLVGGGPEFAAAVLSYGVESLDYVELDPALLDVTRPYLDSTALAALDSDRLHVHFGDARRFLASARDASVVYDVIIVRSGEPSTLLLNRLFTREFMLDARACLAPDGVFVLPLTLAANYFGGDVGRYAGDLHRTAASVFDDVLVTPEVSAFLLASPSTRVLTSSTDVLAGRFLARSVRSDLYPAAFGLAFPPERTAWTNAALASLPTGPVNTDYRPTTYAANLAIWAAWTGSPLARFIARAASAPPPLVFALVVLAALAAALPVFLRRSRIAAARLSILYTGATAMSMTILLIYAFQVAFGYVYNWIGLLVAAFVAGLTLGAMLAERLRARFASLLTAEIALVAAPLIIAAVLSSLPHGGAPQSVRWTIVTLAVLAGCITGFEFPIAAKLLHQSGVDAGAASSSLEAADHLGASIGALLTGVVLVSALGIFPALVLLSAFKAVSASCVALAGRP